MSTTDPAGRKRFGSRHGSVLMETVIAMPIFLVTIGATMWMGELNLSRQRSLAADRYAAWNAGNRHGGMDSSPQGVWTRVFNRDANADVKQVRIRQKSGGWYHQVNATTRTRIRMPAWTHGMIHYGGTEWDARDIPPSDTMTGRNGGHLVVMRGGSHNEAKDDVNWLGVTIGPWWPMIGGKPRDNAGAKFTKTPKYERFGKFVDWSD